MFIEAVKAAAKIRTKHNSELILKGLQVTVTDMAQQIADIKAALDESRDRNEQLEEQSQERDQQQYMAGYMAALAASMDSQEGDPEKKMFLKKMVKLFS